MISYILLFEGMLNARSFRIRILNFNKTNVLQCTGILYHFTFNSATFYPRLLSLSNNDRIGNSLKKKKNVEIVTIENRLTQYNRITDALRFKPNLSAFLSLDEILAIGRESA
jgi:hypothetical protein